MDTIDVSKKYITTTISTNPRSNKVTTQSLGNRIVESLEILFAPGHVALTGVAIVYGGIQMLPYGQPGAFIFGDSERLTFELGIYGPGLWTINTHNADGVAHVHQLTWRLAEIDLSSGIAPVAGVPLVIA